MKAMILAAGLGKRLRPLTDTIPKPMLPVSGKPILQRHIEKLVEIGIKDLVINTHWLGNNIENYFGSGHQFGAEIQWSREDTLLGTGGGIANALPLLGEGSFLLINSDIWIDHPMNSLIDGGIDERGDAHLVLVENPEHNQKGDFTFDRGKVILRRDPGSFAHVTYSGLSMLRPEIFKTDCLGHKVFPLRDVLLPLIQQRRVTGELYKGYWCDIGTQERYFELCSKKAC